jgi:hypothetical protein
MAVAEQLYLTFLPVFRRKELLLQDVKTCDLNTNYWTVSLRVLHCVYTFRLVLLYKHWNMAQRAQSSSANANGRLEIIHFPHPLLHFDNAHIVSISSSLLQLQIYTCKANHYNTEDDIQWVTLANSTDLGRQNPSRRTHAIKLRLKSDVLQLKRHCAKVWPVIFVCELTQQSVIFCFMPRSVLFSWETHSIWTWEGWCDRRLGENCTARSSIIVTLQ